MLSVECGTNVECGQDKQEVYTSLMKRSISKVRLSGTNLTVGDVVGTTMDGGRSSDWELGSAAGDRRRCDASRRGHGDSDRTRVRGATDARGRNSRRRNRNRNRNLD